jgi:hypothetical protein
MSDSVIASFLVSKIIVLKKEFKDRFMSGSSIVWSKALCRNPAAFPFLKKHLKKWLPVHLKWVSRHCSDLEFLRKYESRLDYKELSSNPHALEILQRHPDELDWEELSLNEGAVPLLKQYPERVHWDCACSNTSPEMIEWLEHDVRKIDWFLLSFNPSAISLLKKFPDKIDEFAIHLNPKGIDLIQQINYRLLASNHSDEAMRLIRSRVDQTTPFDALSANPFAIDILLAHPDRIDWGMAKENPRVGELYQCFPERFDPSTCIYESVLPLALERLDQVSSLALAHNPGIFTEDQEEYKQRVKVIERIVGKRK